MNRNGDAVAGFCEGLELGVQCAILGVRVQVRVVQLQVRVWAIVGVRSIARVRALGD